MALQLPLTSQLSFAQVGHPCSTSRSGRVVMTAGIAPKSKKAENLRKHLSPREVYGHVPHSMPPEKMEIFKSLESWVEETILPLLKPIEDSWQPSDFLPDFSSDSGHDELKELQERVKEIPDDYFICLVGHMITEEAVPTYQTMLNTLDGVRDETGTSPSSWAAWTRAWTAEENRHGDLLNKYLTYTGRVDMRQIEKTIQYLIGSGMERATFISHGNAAAHARKHGDMKLAKLCGTIAADEKRHETAYTKIIEKLFEIDPNGTVECFADMMRKKISMPARLMYDGQDDKLFDHFSSVAQKIEVYTAKDYVDILEHLVRRWNVEKLAGLSSRAQEAQDYVCTLAPRFRRLEERVQSKAKKASSVRVSWIFNRDV